MTYIVTERCNNCKYTDCVEVCPVECFHEGPTMLYIDPEVCIDCNACVPTCPVEAIFYEEDLPDKFSKWKEINAEDCHKYPVIVDKQDALPTARTREEILAEEGEEA